MADEPEKRGEREREREEEVAGESDRLDRGPEHLAERDDYAAPGPPPPLVAYGYRRHRPQSPWGFWGLLFPPAALLWTTFWLLMLNQARPGQGESRSAERLAELLRAAGFSSVEECPSDLPLQTRILRARKGSATTAARIV